MSLVWRSSSGLHRALTSTPLNTFGMNWNVDCKPGLLTQYQCLTSRILFRLNAHKFRLTHTKSCGKPSHKSGSCYSCKKWGQLHISAHSFGMRCSTSSYRCHGQVSTQFWPYNASLIQSMVQLLCEYSLSISFIQLMDPCYRGFKGDL